MIKWNPCLYFTMSHRLIISLQFYDNKLAFVLDESFVCILPNTDFSLQFYDNE